MSYKRWTSTPKDFTPCQSAGSALLRCQLWRVPVLVKKERALSSQRRGTIGGLGFMERAYRYSKWLHGTLQVTVSWNPHRRANMPLVLHSTGTDGYDMDYTDSKSIRPRSWVCNGLVNCLWKPFYDSASWLSAAQLQPLSVLLQGGDDKQNLIKRK